MLPHLASYPALHELERFMPLAFELEGHWLDPANQAAPAWRAHHDINAVTLAAALAPRGVLG